MTVVFVVGKCVFYVFLVLACHESSERNTVVRPGYCASLASTHSILSVS